jgi:hypothetical protein
MSELNINRNIFLEKEELKRLQKFLADDITKTLFVKNTTEFGLVLSDFVNSTDFQIQAGTNVGTVKLVNDSFALDKDGLLIYQKAFDNLLVTNNGLWYWVKVSQKYNHAEIGTFSIDTEGTVSGTNTLFTEVLRGQSSEVPVKIKFRKADGSTLVNDQIYEVVDITDDSNITLTGGTFAAESNLEYIVIGSTPISEAITEAQSEGLYKYDSCNLQLIAEEFEDTPPEINYVEDKDFYLARVKNNSGTITLQDKRSQWWTFNIPGIGDKMIKSNNLSDLTDLVQARTNLEVYSKNEVDTLLSPVNNHQQAVGSTLITGSGSGAGTRSDMAGMSITYTPKGNNAMIFFDAGITSSVTAQAFTVYIVKDGVDQITWQETIYQQTYPFSKHFLIPVTKSSQTTIKVSWKANGNFTQNGTITPRILSINDLP